MTAEVQYVTRTVVEKYGGTIKIKKGGVFSIEFPPEGYDLRSVLNNVTSQNNI